MAEHDENPLTKEFALLFDQIKSDFIDWLIQEEEKLKVDSDEILRIVYRHVISDAPDVATGEREPVISHLPHNMNLVSIGEAAEIKGVHRQTIRDALLTGRLKGHQSGKIWLIDRASLDEYKPVEARKGPRKKGQN